MSGVSPRPPVVLHPEHFDLVSLSAGGSSAVVASVASVGGSSEASTGFQATRSPRQACSLSPGSMHAEQSTVPASQIEAVTSGSAGSGKGASVQSHLQSATSKRLKLQVLLGLR